MGLPFRQLRKLWLLYLFLLFFSFFMFLVSINVYLDSMHTEDLRKKNWESHKPLREKSRKNIVVANYIGTGNIFGNMSKGLTRNRNSPFLCFLTVVWAAFITYCSPLGCFFYFAYEFMEIFLDDYNKNNFSPMESEGALGKPVEIPARETLIMQRAFQINRFNLLASDRIPLNRTLKDYRTKECIAKQYPTDLPNTSLIIVFHNEAWSVLLRTVWSVINRSPRHLIKEILLVDDASDRDFLKRDLDEYVSALPVPVKVLRLGKRQGLVPARLLGARKSSGEVLTFLDAHCECSPGWLEPLLARIKDNPESVVCPVIDIISDNNFSYTKTFENHWGAFNWNLHFRWFVLVGDKLKARMADVTRTIPTPAMAGGLFSIRRDYFFKMGTYDENMKIWGGENVEMSFRIWQCGGSVEISPCSHVGHLFRKSSPYTFPGGVNEILHTNLARVALVWMDQWADFFFMYNPIDAKIKDGLDVSERKELRKRLNCKSFQWYLENIWTNNFFPGENRFFGKIVLLDGRTDLSRLYEKYLYSIPGRLMDHSWTSVFKILWKYADHLLDAFKLDWMSCLRSGTENTPYGTSLLSTAIVGSCNPDPKLQDMFVITSKGQIMTNENICLDAYEGVRNKKNVSNVRLFQCHENERQIWEYDVNSQEIRHHVKKLCLTAEGSTNSKNITIKITSCNGGAMQKWAFIPLPWKF